MKQFGILVECVLSDTNETFIIRNAQNGQILKVTNSVDEVASFLSETINTVKSKTTTSHE